MNTRFLATLCAVADTGSLAAAARALNLSNAAVTEQIRALERELGVRLIQRQGRSVALTSEGFAVVGAGRDILARVSDLKQVVQLNQLRGSLRIGSISTALISIVPSGLRMMAEHYPEIAINIVPGTSSHLQRMLELNEIDCAITVKPRLLLTKGVGWHLVRREPLTLISPHDIDFENVTDYFSSKPLIRMDRNSATGTIVTDFLDHVGISPVELFEMDAQETIVMLVSQGLGISLLPDYGFYTNDQRPIRKIIVSKTCFMRDIGILYRQGAKRALVDALFKSLSDTVIVA
ncbi:LysR family transcriptional regulator [Methylobacterium sp. NEAU 140]|uniref:LysR family transcriptional regulator n=1 Tax=Methylobacterium sp. NEAU 140 TaxID=3064945 RepID=UPI0027361A41|nr:LysR family transcriptional regulator [Methylobacterium sp. NEAU 140]MDP4021924.1 LysR family transcriptional regulator [Methylobacterium sp. NEAU 140]